MKLDPFQSVALRDVMTDLRGPSRTALLVAPTGSGKTIMIANVIKSMMQMRRQRVLVLQHTRQLLEQNCERIRSICSDARIGIVGGGRCEGLLTGDIVFSTMQSAKSGRFFHSKPFDIICVDEVHHAPASGYRDLISRLRDRKPNCALLGVTATPGRADGVGLDVLFPRVSHQVSIETVIDCGRVVRPRVLTADLDSIKDALGQHAWTDGDDAEASRLLRVEVTLAEMVRKHVAHAEGRRAVYFCCDTAHAEALAAAFNAAGIKAVSVSYTMRKNALKRTLADFRAGAIDVITNPLMLIEGFDDQALGCIGLARGFGSKQLMVQAVGRVMRSSPETDKTDGLVLDFVEAAKRHGDLYPEIGLESKAKHLDAVETLSGDSEGESEVVEADSVTMNETDMLFGSMRQQPYNTIELQQVLEDVSPVVVSRAQAISLGLKTYFTGKPCRAGHISSRRICGRCVRCDIDYKYARYTPKVLPDSDKRRRSFGKRLTQQQIENGIEWARERRQLLKKREQAP